MTETEQTIAIAELDGFKFTGGDGFIKDGLFYTVDGQAEDFDCIGIGVEFIPALPDYLHSLDAIVPVIKQQGTETKRKIGLFFFNPQFQVDANMAHAVVATPVQLCEALLRATGRWKK